jgi:hypothetical protein
VRTIVRRRFECRQTVASSTQYGRKLAAGEAAGQSTSTRVRTDGFVPLGSGR